MSGNIRDLNQAWDLYYHVFRRISRQLPQLTSLELQYVSPKLLACKDLELAVPGSYTPGQELIKIASIHQNLQVSNDLFKKISLHFKLTYCCFVAIKETGNPFPKLSRQIYGKWNRIFLVCQIQKSVPILVIFGQFGMAICSSAKI